MDTLCSREGYCRGALSDLKEACESGISESTIIMFHINGRSLVTQELPPGCSK